MWMADLVLLKSLQHKYELRGPFVECGGIPNPCIADYDLTIQAMAALRWAQTHEPDGREKYAECIEGLSEHDVRAAQMCRYINKPKPLGFLGDVALEDPATGGLEIERLADKYRTSEGTGIGTAILLSVLEHVDDPFEAIDRLRDAMAPGGIAIVSVPWAFPTHYGPEDNWRISESGLRKIFSPPRGSELPPCWQILESGQHVSVDAEAGVLDGDGKAQIVRGVFIVARAV